MTTETATAPRAPFIRIDSEALVREWQAASSLEQVVEALKATHGAVLRRVAFLRKNGVELKHFPRKGRLATTDFSSLKALAESLNPSKGAA